MHDMKKVKRAFSSHKSQAKSRGIEFKMTFDEWWDMWKPHWHNRGPHKHGLVMCRKMDSGSYEIGNVRIATVDCNARDRSYTKHDAKMAAIRAELLNSEEYDDEDANDDEWLPDELKNPWRSSSDINYF
jgi:hypothetical protein